MTFAGACLAGGALAGALLGALGTIVPATARAAIATLLGVTAVVLGGRELVRGRIHPLQCDRETPQRWVHLGALRWALLNGVTLGCGATTRIGFWLWYAAPAAAFLLADPLFGAAVYGTYGLVRGTVPALLILRGLRHRGWDHGIWLIERAPTARRLAAAMLAAVGALAAVAAGL